MIEHLVFFRPRQDASPEALERMLTALRGLKDSVPGVVELSCGPTFSPERGGGYQVGLRVRLRDRAALAAYLPHPSHQAALSIIREWAQDWIVIDYED